MNRADGRKIKKSDPMYTIVPYIMETRNDAMNMITINIPLAPMQSYINKKRAEGIFVSHMALLLAAYVRVVGEFPRLNRFIVNRKQYARNELSVAMVVLKPGTEGEETMSKMYFDRKNTIFEVNEIIEKYVSDNREVPEKNSTEKLIKILLSIPGLVYLGVKCFKFLDNHALLPKSIIDASPFHNSLCITNLASIRTNHIYHHCYNFGTTSIFIAMGNLREVPKRKGGEIVFEECMPLGVTMDERIASGKYFATAFKKFQKYLANPELLETPPETVLEDEK